ncbi:MAG TPA: STAS domain-containing protein [Thermoleophilaceae bacterium]
MLNIDLDVESEGTSTLVRLRGDLDIQVVEHVTQRLLELEATGPELLVLEVSGLSFVDSAGMAALAAAHMRARDAARRFVVVNPPYGVRRAFEVSALDEVITVEKDLDAVYP